MTLNILGCAKKASLKTQNIISFEVKGKSDAILEKLMKINLFSILRKISLEKKII